MSKTFFNDSSELSKDNISLTRYAGPDRGDGGNRHCLQISTTRFKESLECDEVERREPFIPGWSHIQLNYNEVECLRDQLNRFLEGVRDDAEEGTFDRPMDQLTRKEISNQKTKV
jgi:hypothetical protein